MEEHLKKIIEEHELKLVKYQSEKDYRNHEIHFMVEHNFKREAENLQIKKDAVSDIFYDYRTAIESLRKLLNGWNS